MIDEIRRLLGLRTEEQRHREIQELHAKIQAQRDACYEVAMRTFDPKYNKKKAFKQEIEKIKNEL